MKQVNKLN